MMKLFEKTAMVVYTAGSADLPALTAQARPQDGEIFGEFPPRLEFLKYTKFPVIVPSSTPAYHSFYSENYLITNSKVPIPVILQYFTPLFEKIEKETIKGYSLLLISYLIESCSPREGHGHRTTLYGLQRPPLGSKSIIRCEEKTTYDDLICYLIPYYVTNAQDSLTISCHANNTKLSSFLQQTKDLTLLQETPEEFQTRIQKEEPWNVIYPKHLTEYPLVGNFISQLLPLGHIKSTNANDRNFRNIFHKSDKWLTVRKV